ncbi:hypothetical protein AB1Y20_021943 [Prymnesium parvum]|uniref:Uncharacterized protein n=1 Tax=Prymnesium parvum TaxID=97485 RepID=A0AB34JFS3_PRYPA
MAHLRSPRGVPIAPGIFDDMSSADMFSSPLSPKKESAERLPMLTLVRKLLCMWTKLLVRRTILFSHRCWAFRRRQCILSALGLAAFGCIGMLTLVRLPRTAHYSHTAGGPGVFRAEASPPPPPHGAALGTAFHTPRAEESEQLRRRARELNVEIDQFKARESTVSKQRQLRMTAEQLNSELVVLKQARQASSVAGGGSMGSARRQPSRRAAAGGARQHAARPAVPQCAAGRHPDFRIAMVMPWVSSAGSAHRMPPWLPFLATTAAHSALLVDWLLFHEGPVDHPIAAAPLPNVRFIDLGPGGIAALFARRLSQVLELPSPNASLVALRMRFIIQKWPRLVAEYKPAFGSVFDAYLSNYTHWGYSDLDIVCGQLPRFIERSELSDFHVVTYSFGDNEGIYLRGQWTVHKNIPFVNEIWMGCKHLARGLQNELYQKIVWAKHMESQGKKSYHKRFLSAEGCYSYAALHTAGLKVKVANKQFVGLEHSGESPQHVYVLNGSLWLCKLGPETVDLELLRAASTPACDVALPGVQQASGALEEFEVTQQGCGQWMPQEFRMCAPHLKGRKQNVVIEDGRFYTQRVSDAPTLSVDDGRCKQGAFFHMQEWKKRWGDGNGAYIDPSAAYDAFHLSPNGFFSLPAK